MTDPHEIRSDTLFRSWLVVLLAVAVILWGLGAVYGNLAATGEWEHFLTRQAVWALGAVAVMLIVWRIPFALLLRFSGWLAAAGFGLLLLLPWFGVRINGMLGWYEWHQVMIQPSELVKGVYLLVLVRILARKRPNGTKWRGRFRFWPDSSASFCFSRTGERRWCSPPAAGAHVISAGSAGVTCGASPHWEPPYWEA